MNNSSIDFIADVCVITEEARKVLEQLSVNKHEAAIKVQEAIRSISPKGRCDFPHNWCDFASCVLGLRLARLLQRGDIDLCRWERAGALKAHLWLRIDSLDIDITADQFQYNCNAIIIETDSTWHRQKFPNPTVIPLLARQRNSETFEFATALLDKALSEHVCSRDLAFHMAVYRADENEVASE